MAVSPAEVRETLPAQALRPVQALPPAAAPVSVPALISEPDAVDPQDVEMLQDLVISAVNEALRQADEAMNNSMNSFTGGLNIPGLM